jgi:hypothetical protein
MSDGVLGAINEELRSYAPEEGDRAHLSPAAATVARARRRQRHSVALPYAYANNLQKLTPCLQLIKNNY